MPAPELVQRFVLPLESLDLPYMVTGSVAAMAYGEPRLTSDVDVVIALERRDVPRFLAAFDSPDLYVPPQDVVEGAVAGVGGERQFNIILPSVALKADFYVASGDLDDWGFERRRREPMGTDGAVWIAPPEYVILRKLEFYVAGGSPKHMDDIRAILRLRRSPIDENALISLAAGRGVLDAWERVRGVG